VIEGVMFGTTPASVRLAIKIGAVAIGTLSFCAGLVQAADLDRFDALANSRWQGLGPVMEENGRGLSRPRRPHRVLH
jgi:hypothetical protein